MNGNEGWKKRVKKRIFVPIIIRGENLCPRIRYLSKAQG